MWVNIRTLIAMSGRPEPNCFRREPGRRLMVASMAPSPKADLHEKHPVLPPGRWSAATPCAVTTRERQPWRAHADQRRQRVACRASTGVLRWSAWLRPRGARRHSPMPSPNSCRSSMRVSTSSSVARVACGRLWSNPRISLRRERWPSASSPVTQGWANTWPSRRSSPSSGSPVRRWSIQIDVSTRITQAASAAAGPASRRAHCPPAAQVVGHFHARSALAEPDEQARSSRWSRSGAVLP